MKENVENPFTPMNFNDDIDDFDFGYDDLSDEEKEGLKLNNNELTDTIWK